MSWTVLYFGKENPSLSRKVAVHSLMGMLGLCIYGMSTDFVPSIIWAMWGFYLAIAITVMVTLYLYWAYGTGQMEMQKGISSSKKTFALLVLPFFVLGAFWLIFVHGLPDIVTLMAGDHHLESGLFLKEHHISRRSFDYRLKGEALDRAFPSYVCISSSFYDALPATPVVTTLEGKISVLGFHIQRVYSNSANPAVHADSAPTALRR